MKPDISCRQALGNPNSFATVLTAVLDDQYLFSEDFGEDGPYLSWSPDTLRHAVLRDFGVSLPDASLDRIQTSILLRTTDAFYRQVRTFIDACNILSGDTFDPWIFDPADLLECGWGIIEAHLLAPPEPGDEIFSPEIIRYIQERAKYEGVVVLPDVLAIANSPGDPIAQFSDDPAMYGAVFQMQQSRSDEIKQSLQEGLHNLFGQLATLRLRHGSTAQLSQRARAVWGTANDHQANA
jgi:hypothetical protein